MKQTDLLIVGAGPAGLSAAITARRRNKTVVVAGKEEYSSKLTSAHQVDNYPGLPAVGGRDLAARLRAHARESGAVLKIDEIQSLSPGDGYYTGYGRHTQYQARAVILAPGVAKNKGIPGEDRLLGKGVSYCATCDGMFFRHQPVAVISYLPAALPEALFLAEICGKVYYLPQYKGAKANERLEIMRAKPLEILGDDRVSGLRTEEGLIEISAVFIEREALPISRLLADLRVTGGFINVDRGQLTNLAGVFAAGDCTGQPWQIARAIGEGQVSALSAVDFLAGGGTR